MLFHSWGIKTSPNLKTMNVNINKGVNVLDSFLSCIYAYSEHASHILNMHLTWEVVYHWMTFKLVQNLCSSSYRFLIDTHAFHMAFFGWKIRETVPNWQSCIDNNGIEKMSIYFLRKVQQQNKVLEHINQGTTV